MRKYFFVFVLSFFGAGLLSAENNVHLSELRLQKEVIGNFDILKHYLGNYIKYAKENPEDYEAQWQVSQLSYYLWRYYGFKDKKQLGIYTNLGYKYAKKAKKIVPKGQDAVYYEVMNLTAIGILKGPLYAINVVKVIKSELENMLKLYPAANYKQGVWLRLLGRVYIFAPPFPVGFGDIDKGITIELKATEKFPNEPMNFIYLAIGYAIKGELDKSIFSLQLAEKLLINSDKSLYKNMKQMVMVNHLMNLVQQYKEKGLERIPKNIIKNKVAY